MQVPFLVWELRAHMPWGHWAHALQQLHSEKPSCNNERRSWVWKKVQCVATKTQHSQTDRLINLDKEVMDKLNANCHCCSVAKSWGLFATPWTAACQASLSFTISSSLLKFTSIESVVPSKHLVLCVFVCVCMHVHLTENFGINILNHVDWDYFCWEQQKLILANLRERKRSSSIGLTLEYILQSKEWVIKLWKGKELGSFKA